MATFGSDKVAFLLVDGYSVLGVTTELADNQEALLEETHPLGAAWVEQGFVGVRRAELTQSGFFDDASDSINDALSGSEGVSRVLCYGVEGNTVGKRFVGFAGGLQTNYSRAVSRVALHKASATYQGNGAVEEGVILHALADETADGDTEATSHDNSASTAGGGAGYLQVSALTLGGYDDVTVKIRHSADNVTFADLVTFTDVAAAPAAERKAVAGAVNRYLAASWAFNGAGSNPSVTFMAGFARA